MRTLNGFRLAVAGLLLLLAFRVTITRPDRSIAENWAILLDVSSSMRVKDPSPRIDTAQKIAQSLKREDSSLHMFSFSDQATSLRDEQLQHLVATGTVTALSKALQSVFNQSGIQGAIVLSDGRDSSRSDAASMAATLGKPLYFVGIGDAALFKDAAVRRVQCPPFAFKNTPVNISVTVSANGFAGSSIKVMLKAQDQIVGVQTLHCKSAEHESDVEFSWTPSTLGSKRLTVEVAPQPGETSISNNKKSFSLDVGRDRFRVLFISGSPGPEYGFLRHQFKSDPGVELVTFVILRNNTNTVNVPDAELSLIPFPTEDVFIQQMASFDLVVFDEFSYRSFGLSPSLMQAIGRRIEQGGSFLLMGSPAMFSPGSDYVLHGGAELLPVEVNRGGLRSANAPLALSPKSIRHPIFQIDKNIERNSELWKVSPPLEEPVLGLIPKTGANVLATVTAEGQEHPVLVAWKIKQGRVAVLGVRTTFRWAMLSSRSDADARLYSQFWKNMVLWLTHSSDDKPVRLGIEEKEWEYKAPSTLRVWVFDQYFKPLSDAEVRLQVTWADKTTDLMTPLLETEGVYSVTAESKVKGPVSIRAWVNRSGKLYGQDTLSVVVTDSELEDSDLRPHFDLLREMARLSKGVFVPASEFSVEKFKQFRKESERQFGHKLVLSRSPWVLIILIILLVAEWVIRKWKGLP